MGGDSACAPMYGLILVPLRVLVCSAMLAAATVHAVPRRDAHPLHVSARVRAQCTVTVGSVRLRTPSPGPVERALAVRADCGGVGPAGVVVAPGARPGAPAGMAVVDPARWVPAPGGVVTLVF
jgi:hypothetical protein